MKLPRTLALMALLPLLFACAKAEPLKVGDKAPTVVNAFGVPARVVAGRGEFASRQAYLIKDQKIIYADHTGTTDKQAEVILKVLADQKG